MLHVCACLVSGVVSVSVLAINMWCAIHVIHSHNTTHTTLIHTTHTGITRAVWAYGDTDLFAMHQYRGMADVVFLGQDTSYVNYSLVNVRYQKHIGEILCFYLCGVCGIIYAPKITIVCSILVQMLHSERHWVSVQSSWSTSPIFLRKFASFLWFTSLTLTLLPFLQFFGHKIAEHIHFRQLEQLHMLLIHSAWQ